MLETIAISIYAAAAAVVCVSVGRWAIRRERAGDVHARPDLPRSPTTGGRAAGELLPTEAEFLADRLDEQAAQISDLRATILRLSVDLQKRIAAARQEVRREANWERARAAQAPRRTAEIIDLSDHFGSGGIFGEDDLERIRPERGESADMGS